jgi:hypothetical protein
MFEAGSDVYPSFTVSGYVYIVGIWVTLIHPHNKQFILWRVEPLLGKTRKQTRTQQQKNGVIQVVRPATVAMQSAVKTPLQQ